MQFSGKITNSVITFLQQQGVEASQFYELTDMPVEFLKDPTCWLEAKKTEALLGQLESWAMVFSPFKASRATLDLNAAS